MVRKQHSPDIKHMTIRRVLIIFLISLTFLGLISKDGWAAKHKSKKTYRVSARSAILMDADNQKQLYGKNVHARIFPASTTKVMTALLVMENLPLNKIVMVSKEATWVQPTKAGLMTGEQYKVSDLLYVAIMRSSNDASVVLAQAVAGSESNFLKMMNKRAYQLGARHTKFANSNGLPTKTTQYSTAYDMSLIFKQALKYPFFKDLLHLKNKTIMSESQRTIPIKSYNKLLWKNWKREIAGKTGYTRQARHCFVGYFEDKKKVYIVAVFGCNRRWEDIRYIVSKYGKTRL